MPYQTVPGAKGVKYRPASETMADPNFDVYQDAQGNWHAKEKAGWFMKNLPWIIGGGMGYGALAGAGILPGLAGSGGAAASGLPTSLAGEMTGAIGGASGAIPGTVNAGMVGGGAAAVGGATDYLGQKAATGSAGNVVRNVAGAASQSSPWIQAALAGLSGIPALVASRQNKPSAEELAMQQQIKDMLAGQQRRTSLQDPLFEAVTRLAMNRLPTDVQRPVGNL